MPDVRSVGSGEARYAEQLAHLRSTCPTADTCCLCLCAMERGQAYLFKKCLHSICATCATHELANEGHAVCAVCCEQPGATSMADLVENGLPAGPGAREDTAPPPPLPCSLCTAASASAAATAAVDGVDGVDDPVAAAETCGTCGIALCGPHARLHHKAARTRTHALTPIPAPAGGPHSSAQMCTEHGEPWRAYCTACVTLVCNHCRLAWHLKCGAAVFPLGPAMTAQVAASLAADPVVVADALLTADLARAAAYDAAAALTTQRHTDLVDALAATFATITADVDAREAALRQQLEAASTAALAELDAAEAEALERYRTVVSGAAELAWPSSVPDTALVEHVEWAAGMWPRSSLSAPTTLEKAALVVDAQLEAKLTTAVTADPAAVRTGNVDATTLEQEQLAWTAAVRGPTPAGSLKRGAPPVPHAVAAALAAERVAQRVQAELDEEDDEDEDEDEEDDSDEDYYN